jgi:transposase-like protein
VTTVLPTSTYWSKFIDKTLGIVHFLAASVAASQWTMLIKDWKSALNFFLIQFEDRIEHVA